MILLALFVIPILEIALSLGLIRNFGFGNVFFAWLLLTILGVGLLRTTGVRLAVSVAKSMREGKSPGVAALEAALMGLSGVLLVIPGFSSDILALLLLLPGARGFLARRLIAKVKYKHGVGFSKAGATDDGQPNASNQVIDVEAVVETDSRTNNGDLNIIEIGSSSTQGEKLKNPT
ncbi:MAG: FxsA family protein [Bdellovibrionales bacterium]|jgi:UPF0716 protein FxsA|nr:FxsA family protein [Bdellovibrionales bacterium]